MKYFLIVLFICFYSCSYENSKKTNNKITQTDSIISSDMKAILEQISITSLELKDVSFTKEQLDAKWLGKPPVSEKEINEAEKRLNVKLPEDYVEFLKCCNGFSASSSVEPTFMRVENINYLKDIDPELIKIWIETGNVEIKEELINSIVIAGINDEQYFFLIRPTTNNPEWRYWKFAHWIPGEEEYASFKSYLSSVLDFNLSQLEQLKSRNN